MKNKIGLGILTLIIIATAYGTLQLMPVISLLKEVDISDFAPLVIEEEEIDNNKATENTDFGKDMDNLLADSSKSSLVNENNATDDSGLKNNVSEKNENLTKSNTEKPKIEKSNPQNDKKAKASSTDSSNKSNTKENKNSEAVAVSSNKIDSVEKEITLTDKAKALKLVFSKLSASDIKILKELASGGLTPEEKTKAVKIAYSRYSEEELKLIKEMYNKYLGK